MKICMLSNLFPPVVSGSSTQCSLLSQELVKRGHEVCVVTARLTSDQPEQEVIAGVTVYRLPALRLPRMGIALNFPWLSYTFTPANQARLAQIIERHQPEVLHLHNHMLDLALSAVRMRDRFHIPLVVTLHTMIKHANPFYNLILYPADRIFLRLAVTNRSDVLVHPDVNIAEYSREAFGDRPGALVPYGVSLPQTEVESMVAELKDRYNLHGKRVILSLGHVHEIRNRRDIIEALPTILEHFPETVVLIVGTVATDTPAALARKLGVEHAVIFTGAVPHVQIPAFLALADVEAHWLNQDDPEKTSLGIASLEAMGAGKTILAAANPDTYGRGLLRDGENIVLVRADNPAQLAQTIISLLGDDEKRRIIGEAARKTIEAHFSWNSVCQRTLEMYSNAITSFQS